MPKPTPNPRLTVKGCHAWQAWVRGLARHTRIGPSDLVDVALAEYARNHGHAAPPTRLEPKTKD